MSSVALDMTLDDLIKSNKKSGGGGVNSRGRGRASGPGPARRFPNRGANRASPYTSVEARGSEWKRDILSMDLAVVYQIGQSSARASSIETGKELYISNLDYGVSNEDIKQLFSEVGDLKRYAIHYDRSGRSKGTAEVVFSQQQDALSAVKRYNDVQLDGKPMKIEIVGTNIATPAAGLSSANGASGESNGFRRREGRGSRFGRSHGGRGFGRGFGQGRGRGEKASAEELDADLEKYHVEAMQD